MFNIDLPLDRSLHPFKDFFKFISKYLLIISLVYAILFIFKKYVSTFIFNLIFPTYENELLSIVQLNFETVHDIIDLGFIDVSINYISDLPSFYISTSTLSMIRSFYLDSNIAFGKRLKNTFLNYITISSIVLSTITGFVEIVFPNINNTDEQIQKIGSSIIIILILIFISNIINIVSVIIMIKKKEFFFYLFACELGAIISIIGNKLLDKMYSILAPNDFIDLVIFVFITVLCICLFLLVTFLLIKIWYTKKYIFVYVVSGYFIINFLIWVIKWLLDNRH